MAERRKVKCAKCGDMIDKRYDFGWVKNESTGRYTCASCSRGFTNGSRTTSVRRNSNYKTNISRTPSVKTYKVAGTISKVVGIVILALSLLLLLAVPPVGIFFAIIGVLFFVFGNAYLKKAKAMSTLDDVIDESEE